MTLSTFAYLQENSNNYDAIQQAITAYLGESGYATGTNWQLTWLG